MRQPGVALDHAVLHFDRAAYGIDDAAELDERAVAGALEHPSVMRWDRRVNEVAAQSPKPRQSAVLIRAGHAAETDDIGCQNCRDLPGFGHRAPHTRCTIAQGPTSPE
jgi:hypothetical protein